MPPFVYRCPNTGNLVRGFFAEEMLGDVSSFDGDLPRMPASPLCESGDG